MPNPAWNSTSRSVGTHPALRATSNTCRISNGGRESPDLAMRLGLDPSRMADVRRRARDRFRDELIRVAREGLFAEDDISDLIDALRRLFPD